MYAQIGERVLVLSQAVAAVKKGRGRGRAARGRWVCVKGRLRGQDLGHGGGDVQWRFTIGHLESPAKLVPSEVVRTVASDMRGRGCSIGGGQYSRGRGRWRGGECCDRSRDGMLGKTMQGPVGTRGEVSLGNAVIVSRGRRQASKEKGAG